MILTINSYSEWKLVEFIEILSRFQFLEGEWSQTKLDIRKIDVSNHLTLLLQKKKERHVILILNLVLTIMASVGTIARRPAISVEKIWSWLQSIQGK